MKKEPVADALIDPKNVHLLAVLDNKKSIASTKSTIESLEALIESKQAVDAKANSAVPNVDHLIQKREDLLASVAIGQATEDDVKKFDDDHAAELKEAGKASEEYWEINDEVDQTIAGLKRRLNEAKEQLASLAAARKPLLKALMSSLANQAGDLYVKAATEAYARFMQLLSLERLSGSYGAPLSIRHLQWSIQLPRVNVEACRDIGGNGRPEFLYSDWESLYGTKIADGSDVLLKELTAAGVGSD